MELGEMARQVVDQLVAAQSYDRRALADEQLMDVARHLERARSLIEVLCGRVLVELDDRGACETHTGHPAAGWLAVEAGVPRAVVRRRMKVARALSDRFDQVEAAVADGRLSWEHARVLAETTNPRIAERVAEAQGRLIDEAGSRSFANWRREVVALAERTDQETDQETDQDQGHERGRDQDRNRATVTRTPDGTTVLHAELVGEAAAVVRQALDARVDELFRAHRRDHDQTADIEIPSHATLMAHALVELCRRGQAVTGDAKLPKPEVSIAIWADDPDHAVTDDGQVLPPEITRLFCCGADRTVFWLDRNLVPLNWARKERLATADQRKALKLRDGGCVFPGCDAPPRWCDAHHVHEWDDDGRRIFPIWRSCAGAIIG